MNENIKDDIIVQGFPMCIVYVPLTGGIIVLNINIIQIVPISIPIGNKLKFSSGVIVMAGVIDYRTCIVVIWIFLVQLVCKLIGWIGC